MICNGTSYDINYVKYKGDYIYLIRAEFAERSTRVIMIFH